MTIKRRTKKRINKTKNKNNYKRRTYKIVGGMFNGILSGKGLNVGKLSNVLTVGSQTLGMHSSQVRPARVGTSPTSMFSLNPSNFQPKFQTSKNDIKAGTTAGSQEGVKTTAGPQEGVKTTAGPQEGVKTTAGPQEGVKTNAGSQEGVKTNVGPMDALAGPMGDKMTALTGPMGDKMSALTGPLGDKMAAFGNPMAAAQGKIDEMKNKVQEKIKEYTAKLKNFKGNPLIGFALKTYAKMYGNKTLLKQIRNSRYLQHNKYITFIEKLDPLGKQNYDDACCLIYKYYYINIALNYSYFRLSNFMSENCKDKKYIEEQLRLYNSTSKKNNEHFNEVFYNKKQFSEMQDTDNVTQMRENIEKAFGKTKTENPDNSVIEDSHNYSYLILYILHDISRMIEAEKLKEVRKTKKLKKGKKIKEEPPPPKYDVTKDAKCKPHKDADVVCDETDTALITVADSI